MYYRARIAHSKVWAATERSWVGEMDQEWQKQYSEAVISQDCGSMIWISVAYF